MDSLANIKPITSTGDILEVRHFSDQVETHCRALDALGVSSGNYGSLLILLLPKKLPNDIRLIISRKIDPESGTMSLMMLLNFLKIEKMARERSHVSEKETMTKFIVESPKRHTNVKKFPVSSAALITSERNSQRKSTCIFCRGAHNSGDCKIVNNLNYRRLQLNKLGRCFKCAQRGHLAKCCKNNISEKDLNH